jgi:hypothetical protein
LECAVVRTGPATRPGRPAATVLWAVLVGAAWVVALSVFLHVFPDDRFGASAYRYRDDALITWSHARGLVDVGTVGVGASGARVEGFSSPLMFALATVFYLLGGTRARWFLDGQMVAATFVLGVAVYAALRLAAPTRRRALTAVAASLVAVPLFATFPVFAWHASGMENALTSALAIASVAMLAWTIERGRGMVGASLVVACFALTRAEFVVHALPLLLTAAAVVRARTRTWWPVVALVAPGTATWMVVAVVRVSYFGVFTPNSGAAQEIEIGDHLRVWAEVLWPFAAAGFVVVLLAVSRRLPAERLARHPLPWVAAGLAALFSVLLARDAARRAPLPGLEALLDAARLMGTWWWVLAVLATSLVVVVHGRARPVHALLAVLVVTGLGHLLVFGPARLAGERVVTFVMAPLLVGAASSALAFDWGGIVRARGREAVLLGFAGVACVVAFAGWWANRSDWNTEFGVCCDPSELTPRILAAAGDLRDRTGLALPTVANPDIGLLSVGKTVDVVDLGFLGDPLLRSLWQRAAAEGRPDVPVRYLNHFATPDVVEAHGVWTCQFVAWLDSPEFRARYVKVCDDGWSAEFVADACPVAADVGGGIWVRSDFDTVEGRAELRLTRALSRAATPGRVRRALADCRASATDEVWACQYVTRSVRRNLAAFEAAGTLTRVQAELRGPTRAYDRAVLSARGNGNWYEAATTALLDLP